MTIIELLQRECKILLEQEEQNLFAYDSIIALSYGLTDLLKVDLASVYLALAAIHSKGSLARW